MVQAPAPGRPLVWSRMSPGVLLCPARDTGRCGLGALWPRAGGVASRLRRLFHNVPPADSCWTPVRHSVDRRPCPVDQCVSIGRACRSLFVAAGGGGRDRSPPVHIRTRQADFGRAGSCRHARSASDPRLQSACRRRVGTGWTARARPPRYACTYTPSLWYGTRTRTRGSRSQTRPGTMRSPYPGGHVPAVSAQGLDLVPLLVDMEYAARIAIPRCLGLSMVFGVSCAPCLP